MGEGKFIMPEIDETGIVGVALATVLRQMSSTMDRMGNLLQVQTDKIGEVHTDVQVMKVENKQVEELKNAVKDLKAEVLAMKLRDAEQDGAAKLVGWLKEFGPWIIAMLAFLWGLFGRHPV